MSERDRDGGGGSEDYALILCCVFSSFVLPFLTDMSKRFLSMGRKSFLLTRFDLGGKKFPLIKKIF